jgi:hypothetical protein
MLWSSLLQPEPHLHIPAQHYPLPCSLLLPILLLLQLLLQCLVASAKRAGWYHT